MREAAAVRHWIPSWASQRARARPVLLKVFVCGGGGGRRENEQGNELFFVETQRDFSSAPLCSHVASAALDCISGSLQRVPRSVALPRQYRQSVEKGRKNRACVTWPPRPPYLLSRSLSAKRIKKELVARKTIINLRVLLSRPPPPKSPLPSLSHLVRKDPGPRTCALASKHAPSSTRNR